MRPDSVTVTTVVPTSPDVAFTLFTHDIDVWWRRDARHRPGLSSSSSVVRFSDDQLVEVTDDGSTSLGRVLAWEPGARLVLAWQEPQLISGEKTEVEITFEPDGEGTRVTVEHRGWTDVHTGDTAAAIIGLWWGDLLAELTYRASHTVP